MSVWLAWLSWLAIPVVSVLLSRIDRVQRWYWINLHRIGMRIGHLCVHCVDVGTGPTETCRLSRVYDDAVEDLARRSVRRWWWLTTEIHWPREDRVLAEVSHRVGRTVGTHPNPDGSTTYRYEYPTAVDVGFGTIEGFVITGYPDVPEQN